MKKNKKTIMLGAAITAVVAPVTTVISCGADASADADKAKKENATVPKILTKDNYPEFVKYNFPTGNLEIVEGVQQIEGALFKDGVPNPKTKKIGPIKSLTLPSTFKVINDLDFWTAEITGTLTIPEGVTYIGNNAFHVSKINNLIIPSSVTTIDTGAFANVWKAVDKNKKPAHVTLPLRFKWDLFAIFGADHNMHNYIEFTFTD